MTYELILMPEAQKHLKMWFQSKVTTATNNTGRAIALLFVSFWTC